MSQTEDKRPEHVEVEHNGVIEVSSDDTAKTPSSSQPTKVKKEDLSPTQTGQVSGETEDYPQATSQLDSQTKAERKRTACEGYNGQITSVSRSFQQGAVIRRIHV